MNTYIILGSLGLAVLCGIGIVWGIRWGRKDNWP